MRHTVPARRPLCLRVLTKLPRSSGLQKHSRWLTPAGVLRKCHHLQQQHKWFHCIMMVSAHAALVREHCARKRATLDLALAVCVALAISFISAFVDSQNALAMSASLSHNHQTTTNKT
jgi:hypothetical protein